MKIAVVQTKSVPGDIAKNIDDHQQWVESAVKQGAKAVFFPELSLTGYEPTLAADLAMDVHDERLTRFQTISDDEQITIAIGLPTRSEAGLHISHVIFQPDQPRKLYSKKYLHADEDPFFVSGDNFPTISVGHLNIALAICYELSIPAHIDAAMAGGADLYVACVAKTASGVENSYARFAEIASTHHIPIMFSNCVGIHDNVLCTGQTAAWDRSGRLLAQLDETETGILIAEFE